MCGNTGSTGICVRSSSLPVYIVYLMMIGGRKYNDNVVGSGDRYGEAYFEIKYLRTYTTTGVAPAATNTQGSHLYVSSAIRTPSGWALFQGAWILFAVVFGSRRQNW